MNKRTFLSVALRHRSDPFFRYYFRGRKVLDVGCGRGEFLALDPRNFEGIDIDGRLVSVCKAQGLRAIVGEAGRMAFRDETFEVVRAAQLIEHLRPEDAAQFVAEAARVLTPGGCIYLTTPGVRNVWNTFSHARPYPPSAFKKLLTTPTESYVRPRALPLQFENAWGTRRYVRNRWIARLALTVDVVLPPSNPVGWTIVLRRL